MEAFTGSTTAAEADKGSKSFPSKRWMDGMTSNGYEPRLWKLLEKEKLTDLSQFHQRGFFDEVPFYSRRSDIDFLPTGTRGNELLLKFALKFLNAVIAYERHPLGYFAAITVRSLGVDPVVPNLFVWCRAARELEDKLVLNGVTTRFGKDIEKLVLRSSSAEAFEVVEEISATGGVKRIFVAPTRPPYPGFMALEKLRGSARIPK